MGKRTTAAINKVSITLMSCGKCLVAAEELMDQTKAATAKAKKIVDGLDKLNKEHFGKGGVQRENTEQEYSADPRVKKLDEVLADVNAEITRLHHTDRPTKKKELQVLAARLKSEIDDFDKMLVKKKKAWFGSKNSVPAAENFISVAKSCLEACTDAVDAM